MLNVKGVRIFYTNLQSEVSEQLPMQFKGNSKYFTDLITDVLFCVIFRKLKYRNGKCLFCIL